MNALIQTYETPEGVLPAQVVDAENLPVVDTLYEGMTVAFYSRGRYRAAKVVKIGPKRVTAIYTTEGALKTAEKIASISEVRRVRVEQQQQQTYAAEYRATAEQIRTGQPQAEARHARFDAEQYDEWAASSEAAADETTPEFQAKLAAAEAEDAKPFAQRVVEHMAVTSKAVKRDEVFSIA